MANNRSFEILKGLFLIVTGAILIVWLVQLVRWFFTIDISKTVHRQKETNTSMGNLWSNTWAKRVFIFGFALTLMTTLFHLVEVDPKQVREYHALMFGMNLSVLLLFFGISQLITKYSSRTAV